MKKILICCAVFVCLSGIAQADGFKPAVVENIHSRMINIITTTVDPQTGAEDIFYANGIMISPDLVLAAAHSLRDKDKIFIHQDSAVAVDKERVRFFGNEDFVFIDVGGLGLARVKPIKYGSAEKINYGQSVIVGSRLFFNIEAYFNFYIEGKICVIGEDFFLLDREMSKGSSGSGIYNQKGELIGLVVATPEFGGVEFTLAYKIDTIRRIILERAVEQEIKK